MKDGQRADSGRYAYDGLERVMHEKARLGIMTTLLAKPGGVLFGDLKRLCDLTDGNLSRHLSALAQAGLIEQWKRFAGRRPQTLCRLSDEGRSRFEAYLEELGRVVRDAAKARRAIEREGTREGKRAGKASEGPPGEWQPV